MERLIAFKGLYWKDLKILKYEFYSGIGLMVFMFVVGFALMKYFNEPGIFAVISFMVYLLHALYLPIYLLSSLRTEGKTQLWLHNPNSGSKLFLAKIAAGLTLYMVSFLIVLMITYWTINLAMATGLFLEFQDYVFRGLVLLGISITFMTIFLGIWVIFYWTVYHSMKNIPYVKNIRWLIIVAIWMAFTALGNYISFHPFYKKITQIGSIQINVLQGMSFEAEQYSASITPAIATIHVSIVNGLLEIILLTIVFLFSVWLLERKVEV